MFSALYHIFLEMGAAGGFTAGRTLHVVEGTTHAMPTSVDTTADMFVAPGTTADMRITVDTTGG